MQHLRIISVIFCCLSFASSVMATSIEEIEQGLNTEALNQNNINREDLPSLEDKKKESESAEIGTNSETTELIYKKQAKLIILNKITAKSELVQFRLGQIKFFGKVAIEVNKCAKNIDPTKGTNLVLLTVFDNKLKDEKSPIFHGWMDSSNPSISTLEHPVYEIIPIDCMD